MTTIGQEGWKHMNLVATTRGCDKGGHTTRRWNLHDAFPDGAENDRAVPVPRAAEDCGRGIADRLGRASVNVYFLQLVARLKRDESAIWRPEDGRLNILRAWQRARFKRIQGSNPNEPVRAWHRESQLAAIGRERETKVARRQREFEAHRLGHWGSPAPVQNRNHGCSNTQQGRNTPGKPLSSDLFLACGGEGAVLGAGFGDPFQLERKVPRGLPAFLGVFC